MRFTKVAFAVSGMFAALVVPVQVAAQVVDGSGTANVIPRWIDSNTVGNSNISIIDGVVTVIGKNGGPLALEVLGGLGTSGGISGAGGGIDLEGGPGGKLVIGGTSVVNGGHGAVLQVNGGGGARCTLALMRCIQAASGFGGSVTLQPGAGGTGTGGFGKFAWLLAVETWASASPLQVGRLK
jgi:hypothetical protein